MTEYLGWVYVYEMQPSPNRNLDWTAWPAGCEDGRVVLHAATELDIRIEIKMASKS